MTGKTGGVRADQANSLLRGAGVPNYDVADLPMNARKYMVCIVRNPYERMLSAYLDKVYQQSNAVFWPPGLRRGASFEAFVQRND